MQMRNGCVCKVTCMCVMGVQLLDVMPALQPSAGLRGPGQFTRLPVASTCHSEHQPKPVVLEYHASVTHNPAYSEFFIIRPKWGIMKIFAKHTNGTLGAFLRNFSSALKITPFVPSCL